MKPERWRQIERLYYAALERAPDERAAFLAEACAGDESLHGEVVSFIAAGDRVGSFLEAPADEFAETVAAAPQQSLAGQILGHYRIVSLLGRGGMGEVFLGEDTLLKRRVALKLLAARFTTDPERVRRFEQEARAASALNHPNIITIHEIGTENGAHYLVTEFIEGETLRRRMQSGELTLSKALEIAAQVASGLTVAHEAGIIHRDLKPENVMVRPDGLVKVLDFGLAKLSELRNAECGMRNEEAEPLMRASPDNPQSAIRNPHSTEPGLVMGTVSYMSPEQARGLKVDHRTDIFSLGVMIYEMVTGRRPFEGATGSDVIVEILRSAPLPVSQLKLGLPPELERMINRMLAKEREARYQSAAELRAELQRLRRKVEVAGEAPAAIAEDNAALKTKQEETAVATDREQIGRWSFTWRSWQAAAIGLAPLMLAAFVYLKFFRSSPELPPPQIVPFTSFPGNEMQPSFSPDGNQIAFVWDGEKGDNQDIYVKQPGNEALLRLTTNPAADLWPCWSPDGRYIAFTREMTEGSGLYLIPSLGGAERRITQLSSAANFYYYQMSWSPDGEWLAIQDKSSPQEAPSIFLVARETGEKRKLTTPPAAAHGDRHPAISPDGKTVAFVRFISSGVGDLYLVPTAGAAQRLTFDDTGISSPVWTPDGREILFLSGRGGAYSLWRVSANSGTPVQIEAAGRNLAVGVASIAVSRQGQRLAWTQTINDQNIWRMELADAAAPRDRKQSSPSSKQAKLLISSTRIDASPEISPDGKRVVFASNRSGNSEIWVADSTGERPVQLTAFNRWGAGSPRWSPDSLQIVFDARAAGNADIYVISAEGGQPRHLTTDPAEDVVPSWSRDGNWIYFSSKRSGSPQIWRMPAGGGEATQVTRQGGVDGMESPDGQFLYYTKARYAPGIWRMPVAGGEETLALDHHRAGYWRYWTVVEQGIYFATAERPKQPLIEFFSFATGQVTLVAILEKELDRATSGLAVSADGRWLIWSQLDQVGSDIMLMENFR